MSDMFLFDHGFQLMSTIVGLGFLVVFGIIIFTAIKNLRQYAHNNQQPILAVEAKVVTKRHQTSHHHNHASSTRYYVTFEVQSGDRLEFHVSGQQYGFLVEGDQGKLTFQGTRYHSFERVK